jgi:hypothetical protein
MSEILTLKVWLILSAKICWNVKKMKGGGKRKGLSLDDKRQKLLDVYYDTK